MKEGYEPKTYLQGLGAVVEECGEVLKCSGKILRFGRDGVNPDDPKSYPGYNEIELLMEMDDLTRRLRQLRVRIENTPLADGLLGEGIGNG